MGGLIACALGLALYSGTSDLLTDHGSTPAPPGMSAASNRPAPNELPPAPAAVPGNTPQSATESVSSEKLLSQHCAVDPDRCACHEAALLEAFERRANRAARTLAENRPTDCDALLGISAEALARNGLSGEARALADKALARDGKDPYATYARALALYQDGASDTALNVSLEAARLGRGASAHVLIGLIEYAKKNFQRAEQAFSEALRLDSNNADATYNLAVLNQRRNRYREAREGYLKTLRLDPAFADARYNLSILTLRAGATAEARHHFERLEALVGASDTRVQRLRRGFDEPAKQAGFKTLQLDSARDGDAKRR
jgi:tetratricopeptide (TPR) repeat protein